TVNQEKILSGLRQGDPLSPYLFILCADVLSGMLKFEAKANRIHGIQVARKARKISHLFFTDDNLMFSRASILEANKILDILKHYQVSSSQMVNLDKYEASFSQNVSDSVTEMIRNRMGINTVQSHSRYLGLSVVFGRSKKEVFSLVLDHVWKKLKGWKEGVLSMAKKEVLIKVVAQEISSYVRSCFKLPEGVCKDLEGMMSKF
ncbi:unnamed protein product, partial [Vicia faba]